MAHLWHKDSDAGWTAIPLGGETLCLAPSGIGEPSRLDTMTTADSPLLRGAPVGGAWLLFAPASVAVHVNGAALPLGIRALEDRDEVLCGDAVSGQRRRFYFSTERLAGIEPFPGREGRVVCPRCKMSLEQGQPAVECPGCGAWHHQMTDRGCWLYAEQCALCAQLTSLDAGYRWSPEDL